jgi:uncharacterized protein YndB with AHSA1/START domain/DNA-binding transcriptional ArsR family regulator
LHINETVFRDEEKVFKALADASRRKLLDRLRKDSGVSLNDLCEQHDMTRQAVAKHLAILEAANLVVTVKRGREKLHFLNPVPINEIYTRWIGRFDAGRLRHWTISNKRWRRKNMARSEFVYTTYIKATPQKVWEAITNPEFMKQYWFGSHYESDFKAGSPWRLVFPNGDTADAGEILESDPPKRMVIKWRNEWRPELNAEGDSRCTFEIEAIGNATKLTVTHVIDRDGSKLIEAVSGGWPRILSNLKSLLETGQVVMETK